jgi:protein PhnA
MPHTETPPACIQCGLENTYIDSDNFVCPDCGHEWPTHPGGDTQDTPAGDSVVRDSNGNPLSDGDSVILIKDLKVKGTSVVLKKGTKVKSIRLADGGNGHDVDCKTELGSFFLKSGFLRKA